MGLLRRFLDWFDCGAEPEKSIRFCVSASSILAKLAKADGRVTKDEIEVVERAFARLGFSQSVRRRAVEAFRIAKDDSVSVHVYAVEFAAAVRAVEVRELFYEMLWDIAAADGHVSEAERSILKRIPRMLGIRSELYAMKARRYLGGGKAVDALAEAYETLGASARDDSETLRRRYRELAKSNHPDTLRAQGLPEELIGKATERMSRINAAWTRIKAAREAAR